MNLNFFKLTSLLIIILYLLTGCSEHFTDYISDLTPNSPDLVSDTIESFSNYIEEISATDPHEYTVNIFNKVFELVQVKDTQAIFDMFSEYAKENINIMPEIERLVKFMDSEITEIKRVGASNDYMSVRDGVIVSASYSAAADIKTSDGITYWFKVGVITADTDETKLGLDWIYILDCNAKTVYRDEWRSWYDNDGSESTEPQRPEDMEVGVNY